VLTYKKKTCFCAAVPFCTGSWSFDAIALVIGLETYAEKRLTASGFGFASRVGQGGSGQLCVRVNRRMEDREMVLNVEIERIGV
jgi:hypothetical protein